MAWGGERVVKLLLLAVLNLNMSVVGKDYRPAWTSHTWSMAYPTPASFLIFLVLPSSARFFAKLEHTTLNFCTWRSF